jgi:hypothetical protein
MWGIFILEKVWQFTKKAYLCILNDKDMTTTNTNTIINVTTGTLAGDVFYGTFNTTIKGKRTSVMVSNHIKDSNKEYEFRIAGKCQAGFISIHDTKGTASGVIRGYQKNSLVNIITETYFFSNIIHITEKTFKPIAFMQPFVMVGSYGSLQHIKEMGFKTFSEFWDESYDLEKDDVKRFTMVMSVIESIASWPDHVKIDFTYAVKDIVEYNLKHLNSMPNKEIDDFVEKYGT